MSTAVIKARLGQVDPKFGTSALERIVERMIRLALQGSYKDKKLLLAYGLGMPKQSVEVEGDFSFTDALTSMRAKKLAEADQTIRQYFTTPALPVVGPNGHSTPGEAQVAATDLTAASEDAEQPAVEKRPAIRVEL